MSVPGTLGLTLQRIHDFINPHLNVTLTQVGDTYHCVCHEAVRFDIFVDLCYHFDCDAHYVTRSDRTAEGDVVVVISDIKTAIPERVVTSIVRARIKKHCNTLKCGPQLRERIEKVMLSICGFSTVRFLPNFTFETRPSRDPRETGIAIICNMSHLHVLDIARLQTSHALSNVAYQTGYLICELLPNATPRDPRGTASRKRDRDDSADSADSVRSGGSGGSGGSTRHRRVRVE